ncbi:MAG: hypothetical protein KAU01_06505 [Candidatus Cloacimonetes bacterium]|nr:hypothetical protein [Candidatus Cloacimonadota bacterium]
MITESTVFILGAGASKPYDFPLGNELKEDIRENFIRGTERNILYDRSRNPLQYKQLIIDKDIEKAKDLFNALNSRISTIDLILSLPNNQELVEIGKQAIIERILHWENESKLKQCVNTKEDWMGNLLEDLIDCLKVRMEKQYNKLNSLNLNFITFNYDRSLEYFFKKELLAFDFNEDYIKIFCDKIIHVYGKVAPLCWSNNEETNSIPFGSKKVHLESKKYIDNIFIVDDKRNNNNHKKNHEIIKNAKRIFFLGFGFAKENLEILNIKNSINANQKIYGTAYGFTPKEIQKIKSYFSETYKIDNPDLVIEDCDCLTLLRNYL